MQMIMGIVIRRAPGSWVFYINLHLENQENSHEAISATAQGVALWEIKGAYHHNERETKGKRRRQRRNNN